MQWRLVRHFDYFIACEIYFKMKRNKGIDMENGFGEFGGYMNAKVSKLEEQFANDVFKNPYKKSDLFAGISIFVNGLTNPSADELKRIMMAHGGVYHTYQRNTTTYVIATNLPDVKIRQLGKEKIISPQWIVDCLNANKILDYSKYLLYTERKTNQPKISAFNVSGGSPLKTHLNETAHEMAEQCEKNNIEKGLAFLNKQISESNVFNDEGIMNPTTVAASENLNKNQARTAVDPKFLSEFYNNSRLHHIATLGANFKEYIFELREKHSGVFPARGNLQKEFGNSLSTNQSKTGAAIMHIDMDCFFVSVGLRTRPHLKGEPVAVTHSKGASAGHQVTQRPGVNREKEIEMYQARLNDKLNDNVSGKLNPTINNTDSLSEIASCSYEARAKGVKNGMFVGAALKLCPNLKTIPYDFEAYKEVAFILYDTMAKYTLDIEPVSCDEMYVDLANICQCTGISVEDFVTFVRNEIKSKTNCPCSAGIGGNRLQARMATKKAKPNGQFFLQSNEVEEYFRDIEISDLPGVGFNTKHKLLQLQWKTCEDLQQIPLKKLKMELGKKFGEKLYQYCRGIDTKSLSFEHVRKSVSAEVNYGIRFSENDELETFLRQLCQEVHSRLVEIKRQGKTITLKYMVRAANAPIETAKFMGHGVCDNITKSITLTDLTSDLNVIIKNVLAIKNTLKIEPKELRGIGIQISKLDANEHPQKSNVLRSMFEKVIEKNQQKNCSEIDQHKTDNKVVNTRNKIASNSPNKTAKLKSSRGRKRQSRNVRHRDIMSMLTELKNRPTIANGNSNIDMNVLSELPDDIQKEILRNYKSTELKQGTMMGEKTPKKNPKLSELYDTIDPEFLTALPSDIRHELLTNLKTPINSPIKSNQSTPIRCTSGCSKIEHSFEDVESVANVSKDNILTQKEWRSILKSWLESTDDPLPYDVEKFTNFAIEMIRKNQLNDVYIALRYFHRIIDEHQRCTWHLAYHHIIAVIQEEMVNTRDFNIRLLNVNHIDGRWAEKERTC